MRSASDERDASGGRATRTLMPVLEAEVVRSDEGDERPDMLFVLEGLRGRAGRAEPRREGERGRVTRAR